MNANATALIPHTNATTMNTARLVRRARATRRTEDVEDDRFVCPGANAVADATGRVPEVARVHCSFFTTLNPNALAFEQHASLLLAWDRG